MRRQAIVILLKILFITAASINNVSSASEANSEQQSGARFEEIASILNQIESGRAALEEMEQYNIKVQFKKGQGAYFKPQSNTIFLNEQHSPQRGALSFVHEMTHASYFNECLRADAASLDRELYVRLRIDEEAEGVVRSIEAKKELAVIGIAVDEVIYPLEPAYWRAYYHSGDGETVNSIDRSAERGAERSRGAGMERVVNGFTSGEVVGSRSKSSYPAMYGSCWNRIAFASNLAQAAGQIMSEDAAMKLFLGVHDLIFRAC